MFPNDLALSCSSQFIDFYQDLKIRSIIIYLNFPGPQIISIFHWIFRPQTLEFNFFLRKMILPTTFFFAASQRFCQQQKNSAASRPDFEKKLGVSHRLSKKVFYKYGLKKYCWRGGTVVSHLSRRRLKWESVYFFWSVDLSGCRLKWEYNVIYQFPISMLKHCFFSFSHYFVLLFISKRRLKWVST